MDAKTEMGMMADHQTEMEKKEISNYDFTTESDVSRLNVYDLNKRRGSFKSNRTKQSQNTTDDAGIMKRRPHNRLSSV